MNRCPSCKADNPAEARGCHACGAMLGRQAVPWGWAVLTAFMCWATSIPFAILQEKTGIPAVIADPVFIALLMGYAAGVRPILWLAPLGWAVMILGVTIFVLMTSSRPSALVNADKLALAVLATIAIGAVCAALGALAGYAITRRGRAGAAR